MLVVLGIVAAAVGNVLEMFHETCIQLRCTNEEALLAGMIGGALFVAGGLVGLAGIGLIVAGVLTDPRPRAFRVGGARASRPCATCGVVAPDGARYCANCGTALAVEPPPAT